MNVRALRRIVYYLFLTKSAKSSLLGTWKVTFTNFYATYTIEISVFYYTL